MKKHVLLAGLLCAAVVAAADSIPFTFTPGSPIKSAEVNENFKSLQTTAAAHESRLQGLEATISAKPADQLVCLMFGAWAIDGTSFPCIQALSPAATRSMNVQQILAEGWISVAIGGGDNSNRLVWTLRK